MKPEKPPRFKCKKANADLEKTVGFLKVISEKNRLLILCLLQKREMCACEMWQNIGIHQNLASHHLKVLKDSGLIKSRREGSKIVYSLDKKNIRKHVSLLNRFVKQ